MRIVGNTTLLGICVTAALALTGCGDQAKTGAVEATLFPIPCRVANVENEVRCATLDVFENRDTRQGRKIGLHIVVLPATARIKEPDPVFVFAGGPGQAASQLARESLAMLGGLNTRRDIVLIDQRGTGKSNGLGCKFVDPDALESIDPAVRAQEDRRRVVDCRDALAARADLTRYTTTIAMADIEDARVALGYEKINLWGGSYGTRAAMEYLRRHPAAVRSVVLDGVAPPSMALPATFARDAGAAYDKMLDACAREAGCAKRFPQLKSDIDELLARAEKSPRKIFLPGTRTGEPREIVISRDAVLSSMFVALYVPQFAAMLPEVLSHAGRGNFAPLLAIGDAFGVFDEEKIFAGMRFSVVCAEDLPRIAASTAGAERAPFGGMFVREMAKACGEWPRGAMAKDFDQPVQSDKPVLILSGALDPVTPPIHGEEVAKSLPRSRHLIAPNIGHGVSAQGCAPRLIKKFIESARVENIDGACLARLPRPLFYEPMRDKKVAGK